MGGGLIGGSILLALAAHDGFDVTAVEADAATRRAIRDAGIAVADDVRTLARACDLVVVCTPPGAAAPICVEALAADEGVIVTDVLSVKVPIVRAVRAALGAPERARFVPGHPLAGRERGGFANATRDLFHDAVWALTPDDDVELTTVLAVARGVWALGARTIAVEPEVHDRAVAYSSHAPHLVASALARATPPDVQRLAARLSGGGLRDATRIASSDAALWREIVSENRAATLEAVAAEIAALGELAATVERGDWDAFTSLWEAGRAANADIIATRWAPVEWEEMTIVDASTRDLVEIGMVGRLVAGATFGGGDLVAQVSREPVR